jgi:hypothetical protein
VLPFRWKPLESCGSDDLASNGELPWKLNAMKSAIGLDDLGCPMKEDKNATWNDWLGHLGGHPRLTGLSHWRALTRAR